MPTPKQAAASRANAQKSTGPHTAERKTASRFNPLKHGICAVHQIMFDETAEDLAELAAEYHAQYSPADAKERFLVDTLVHNEWRLRRMRRVEAVLWEHAADAFLAQHPEAEACNSAHAFTTNSGYFERLQRTVNACERNYHRALKELQRLQVARAHGLRAPEPAAEPPQPQQSTTGSEKLASIRQNPKTPPTAAPKPPDSTPLAGRLRTHTPRRAPRKPGQDPQISSQTSMEAIEAATQAILDQQ
jgi:hypothetical protein